MTQPDAERAKAIKAHLDMQGLPTAGLTVGVKGGAVEISGAAQDTEVVEKAILTVGNVAGIESVSSTVAAQMGEAPAARSYMDQQLNSNLFLKLIAPC